MTSLEEAAADQLVDAWRNRAPIARLPLDARPEDVDAAYAIQDAVAARRGPITGWKLTHAAIPLCSPVFSLLKSGVALESAQFHIPRAEVEFGFLILEDMPPRKRPYSADEVSNRLAFIPVIEIVSSRYIDHTACSKMELLADGANGALIVGEAVHEWRAIDFREVKVRLALNGQVIQSALGDHPLESPASLVVWLANHATRRCGGLKRGMVATTGGLKGADPVGAGDVLHGTWQGLGAVNVALT
jgi:2-keto-4-pentenoate hydratase